MPLTLADLFASPDHYLHSIDGDAAVFVPMDRAAYHRSIFLDGRIAPAGEGTMRVPLSLLVGAPPPPPLATSWIFHVAHCGSTLLARALDRPSGNLVLREPLALRQVALAPDRERLALVAAMLSRRYRPDAVTLVKANVPVNFILPALAGTDPDASAIFLYLGLKDYLLAVLRSDNHRDWLGRVTGQLGQRLGDVPVASDAERAAALWTAQMRAFAEALALLPNARSLDGEAFFASPAPTLAAAARQLRVEMSADEVEAHVAGPLFATYSKNPDMQFDDRARRARASEAARMLAAEMQAAAAWVDRAAGGAEALEATVAARALQN